MTRRAVVKSKCGTLLLWRPGACVPQSSGEERVRDVIVVETRSMCPAEQQRETGAGRFACKTEKHFANLVDGADKNVVYYSLYRKIANAA